MDERLERFVGKLWRWCVAHYILVIILGAVVAMAISLYIGLNQSVWFDESYSILVAKNSLSQLLYLTSVDTHPPLFYIVLKLWGGLFGWSDFALRSLIVLFLGGSVLIAGLLVRRLFGAKAVLVTLPFLVFAPFLLRYGFEIRMYSMASFIGVAATYVLVSALEHKNKRRQALLFILYGVLVAVGVYTLYYTVLLWIAHVVWLVWRARANKESIVKSRWFAAYVLSVILFLPWIINFLHQITNGALAPISQPMTLDNLFGVLSFSFLYSPVWQLDAWSSLVMVFVIFAVIYLAIRAFSQVEKQKKQYLILLGSYFAVPIVILTLVGLIRPMYVERYLAHVLIGLGMFVGVSVYIVQRKYHWIKWAALALVFVMLAGVANLANVGNFNFQRMQRTQTKQLAQLVNCNNGGVVLVDDPYFAVEFSYYLTGCRVFFFSTSDNLKGGYAPVSNMGNGISNPEKDLARFRNIYHIYYDKSNVKTPDSLKLVSTNIEDSLTVEHLSN